VGIRFLYTGHPGCSSVQLLRPNHTSLVREVFIEYSEASYPCYTTYSIHEVSVFTDFERRRVCVRKLYPSFVFYIFRTNNAYFRHLHNTATHADEGVPSLT
jgi:hypothetical protein